MADLLDEIQRQIDSRVEELRPFAEEARHLERARDALDAQVSPAAGRGSARRVTAPGGRSVRGDTATRVIANVEANPGSTASEVASALGLKRASVATRLTQLTKQGKLVKASRGYRVA